MARSNGHIDTSVPAIARAHGHLDPHAPASARAHDHIDTQTTTNTHSLKLVTANVNSLAGKLDQVRLLVRSYAPDAVLVQEIKLATSYLSSALDNDGYDLFRKDRTVAACASTYARCCTSHN
jgi:hypothetical protein